MIRTKSKGLPLAGKSERGEKGHKTDGPKKIVNVSSREPAVNVFANEIVVCEVRPRGADSVEFGCLAV